MGRSWSPFTSPQPDTSRSRRTTDTGLVHRVVCPFTPQLSLVLINRPRKDGTLSWRWCTAATGGSRTCDLAVPSPAPYHSATAHQNKNRNKLELEYAADRTHFSASPSDERLAMMTVPCGSEAALHSVMPSRPANRGSSTLNVITDLGSGSSAVTPVQTNHMLFGLLYCLSNTVHLLNISEFVYFVWGLSPPKRCVVR